MLVCRRLKRSCFAHHHPRDVVAWLWIVLLLLGEWLIYPWTEWRCRSSSSLHGRESTRIAVIADPQLTDQYSYSQKPGLLLSMVEFYSDIYMRRAFRTLQSHYLPHIIVFLGDLTDGGREWTDEHIFNEGLSRFQTIFYKLDGQKFYYVAGNHDIGFGPEIVPSAYQRFRKTFGNPNFVIPVGKCDVVGIDSIALSGDTRTPGFTEAKLFLDDQASGKSFAVCGVETDTGNALKYGAHLLTRPARRTFNRTTIVISHVPFNRPSYADCGKQSGRVAPDIHQAKGYQYQNLITQELTQELLSKLKPNLVLSGDDHDQCFFEHTHRSESVRIPEYTIGTFSWLQGNRYPSYARLDIQDSQFHLQICLLPSQFRIYMVYIIVAILSLAYLYEKAHTVQDLPVSVNSSRSHHVQRHTLLPFVGHVLFVMRIAMILYLMLLYFH